MTTFHKRTDLLTYLSGPIAGSLSSVPGLTHQMRALFALTMCARWGTDLGPVDRGLHDGLCRVVGPELNLLCNYIGTVAKLLATILPAVPVCPQLSLSIDNFLMSNLGFCNAGLGDDQTPKLVES